MTLPSATGPGDRAVDGRVALVTGGSGGIGRAMAHRLAAAAGPRWRWASGTTGRPPSGAIAAITEAGGRAAGVAADLGHLDGPGELLSATEAALGPVDVLVSNAGTGRAQPLGEITAADFDEVLAVNLRAPFLLAQRALPGMAHRGFGRVLFMSSVAAFTGESSGRIMPRPRLACTG